MRYDDEYSIRGAFVADIPAVAELLRTSELFDEGEASVTVEDLQSDWQAPGFDPESDVLIVHKGARMVAYGEVPGWRAQATVHPDWRGRGLGTRILRWMEQRAIERSPDTDEVRIGQTVKDSNTGAIELFTKNGYSIRHTSWALRLPPGTAIAETTLPDDIFIRIADLPSEEREVYQVVEDAFNEWPTRTPSTFDEWRAHTTLRADFEPDLLLVAATPSEVVGVSFCIRYPDEGWVQQLAVRSDRRGEGIAKALLRSSFTTLVATGSPVVGLSTDSRTGALDLYTNLGMVVRSTYVHYSKVL